MNIKSIMDNVNTVFQQNLQDFCKNNDTSQLTEELTERYFGVLKDALSAVGQNAIKEFIESYDVNDDVILAEGQIFRYKYHSSRPFLTFVGSIDIARRVYQNDRGGKAFVPLDRKWGMEHEYATLDVREAVLYSCAHNTPEETVNIFRKISLFDLHPTTIKRISDKTGAFFEAHKESLKQEIFAKEEAPKDFDVIVASMDGVNVLLNEKGGRKGRPKERPVKEDETIEHYAYKNAMCGSILFYRQGDGTKENRPERIMSRYVSKMPEERAVTFKKDLEKELDNLHERISDPSIKYVMLCDGARGIWNYVENNELYKGYKFLVDFYHTSEHLSKASEAIFGKSTIEGKKWYKKWYEKLQTESGASNALYRSILHYRDTYDYPKTRCEALKAEVTFFKRNKGKMQYAEFLSSGLPIGSGPVEAACKSLVRQRMCRSGQRWSRKKGDNILQFRTLVKSGRWDLAWDWFRKYKKVA